MFYEVSPYSWRELNGSVVLELTVNNYKLVKLLTEDGAASEEVGGKRMAEESTEEEVTLITSRELEGGRKWYTRHNLATGVLTIAIRVDYGASVQELLNELTSTYPQLRLPLNVYDIYEHRISNLIYGDRRAHNFVAHSPFCAVPPPNKKITLLDSDERVLISVQVVFFVRLRNSSYTDMVTLQGLPHPTKVEQGDTVQSVISRIQPRLAPCYPQLTECTPALISHNNRATFFEGDYTSIDLKAELENVRNYDIPVLGFELSAPLRAPTKAKKTRGEGGIKIDC